MLIFKKISVPVLGAKGMPHFILKVSSGLEKQSYQKKGRRVMVRKKLFVLRFLEVARSINP